MTMIPRSIIADRDRFISKGHACVAVYAALAELGFISRESLDLMARMIHG